MSLTELLPQNARAIVVGINPSPVSCEAGHYYQGKLGQRLWDRLSNAGIIEIVTPGAEDRDALAQGFGFTDLVLRPTPRATDLSSKELGAAVPGLQSRLSAAYPRNPRPLILFTFAMVDQLAGQAVRDAGFETMRLPAPYAPREDVALTLKAIAGRLS